MFFVFVEVKHAGFIIIWFNLQGLSFKTVEISESLARRLATSGNDIYIRARDRRLGLNWHDKAVKTLFWIISHPPLPFSRTSGV